MALSDQGFHSQRVIFDRYTLIDEQARPHGGGVVRGARPDPYDPAGDLTARPGLVRRR